MLPLPHLPLPTHTSFPSRTGSFLGPSPGLLEVEEGVKRFRPGGSWGSGSPCPYTSTLGPRENEGFLSQKRRLKCRRHVEWTSLSKPTGDSTTPHLLFGVRRAGGGSTGTRSDPLRRTTNLVQTVKGPVDGYCHVGPSDIGHSTRPTAGIHPFPGLSIFERVPVARGHWVEGGCV